MSDETTIRSRRLANAVVELPSWKKKLLSLSLMAALIGGGAKVASMAMMREEQKAVNTTTAPAAGADGSMPGNASGFVGRKSTAAAADGAVAVEQTVEPQPSFTERASGWIMKIGLSIFAGVVVGTIFRMFVKTMAVLAALVVTLIGVLSYFNVLNIDFTTMKTNYDSAAAWASDQAWRLKEVVMNYLPSTTMAVIGFFLGFKK